MSSHVTLSVVENSTDPSDENKEPVSPVAEDIPPVTSEADPSVSSKLYMGQGPVLKNWKIMGRVPQNELADQEAGDAAKTRSYSDRKISGKPVAPFWLQIGQALAVFMTMAWLTYASIYIMALPGSIKAITSSPLTLGGIMASVLAPIAMLWLCIATWQRRSDAHLYAQALREELRNMIFPGEDQSNIIGEDIRLLMKQATEMSSTSRAAIKAIQRARSGLRAEIRDFAGTSQKAEFHIDRLADSLSKRAEELLSLTETIEAQTNVLSDKAQRGIGAWENVSAEISEIGNEISEIFESGKNKLLTVTDQTKDHIKAIEGDLTVAVENLSSKIGSVALQIDSAHETLDMQSEKLKTVSETITDGAFRLEQSLSGAGKISEAVEGVMDVMTTSLGKVESTAESLFMRTESMEKKLEDRAEILRASAEKLMDSTDTLENVGDQAAQKLAEALSMAISGAESITGAVLKSKEVFDRTVQDASGHIAETTAMTGEKVAHLMEIAKIHRDQLEKLIAEMDARQQSIVDTIENLDGAQTKILSSAEQTKIVLDVASQMMSDRAQEPLLLIEKTINRLGEQTQEFDDKLSVRIIEVETETEKLRGLVDHVSQSLQSSLQDVNHTVEQVELKSGQLGEGISVQRANLKNMVSDLEDNTRAIGSLLRNQSQQLSESLTLTESQISILGQMFFERGDMLVDKISEATDDISSFEEKMAGTLSSISRKVNDTENFLSADIDKIKAIAEKFSPECNQLMNLSDMLSRRYTDLKENYLSATDTASSCLAELGDRLEQRLEKLGSGTMESSKAMLALTEDLTGAYRQIRGVSEEAQERMGQIHIGVKDQIDDLQSVTDQVRDKVDGMQANLDTYMRDLNVVVGRAMADLKNATEEFGKSTYMLDSKADVATAKILEGSKQYIEEGHRMAMLGEQALHKSSRIVGVIQEESNRLLETAKLSLIELQKAGDLLSARTHEIEGHMKSSLMSARGYSEELRGQISMIVDHSAEAADQITDSTARLSARAQEVRQISSSVTENIELSRQKLSDEGTRLTSVAKKAIEAADEASNVFTRHSTNLYKTVSEMAEQAKKVRENQVKVERESFLMSAKFVIESLYSIAVDVARHLEDDLDMRVLKSYQKGDIGAFTRHLIEMAPRIPADKCQRKFIEDGEFRTYVLRFIRQFEELLEQANQNDYADLLSSVFSTSDIGKLYKILCEIAGRNAKTH